MVILLFGPPGCGKGTQARFVCGRLGVPAISTGEMLRAACEGDSTIGDNACWIVSRGGLVDDGVVNRMVRQRVSEPDCRKGFLLDGFPRTTGQAAFLDDLLDEIGLPHPDVVHLHVPDSVLLERIALRRQCPRCSHIYHLTWQPPRQAGHCDLDGEALIQRKDDHEAVFRNRLKAYESVTRQLVEYYRPRSYHKVDGARAPDQVSAEIASLLAIPAVRNGLKRPAPLTQDAMAMRYNY